MPRPSGDDWNSLILAYCACTLVLAIKYSVSQFLGFDPKNHPAEDEKLVADKPQLDSGVQLRRARQAANDTENIPMNLVIFWAAFVIQSQLNSAGSLNDGQAGTRALTVLIVIYTFSRLAFTYCYLCAVQPFRSIFFLIGLLATLASAGVLMYSGSQLNMNKIL
jgi:uncharacterized MAPEG superfamily protein